MTLRNVLFTAFLVLMTLNIAQSMTLDGVDTPLKAVSSDSRSALLKEIIQDDPDVTMRTLVPSLYERSWVPDFKFAKQQIQRQTRRPIQNDILRALDLINSKVGENRHLMSFGYLNFAWGVVADVLSPLQHGFYGLSGFESKIDSLHAEYLGLLETVESRLRSGDLYQARSRTGDLPIYLDQILMSPPGIFVLPHVSKTGFLAISKMVEGLGIKVGESYYAFAFLAIGTNEILSYDGYENKNARDTRVHDCRHLQAWHLCGFEFYGFGGPSGMSYRFTRQHKLIDEEKWGDDAYSSPQQKIMYMVQFKEMIASVLNKPSVLYYLFTTFHENLRRNETVLQTICSMRTNYTRSYPEVYIIDQQKTSNMSDAKSLMPRSFKWHGETIEDQYLSYLDFEDEGCRLIQEFLS